MKLNKIASLNANRVLYVLVVCISFTILLEINISSNVYAENQTISSSTYNSTLMFVDEKYNIIAAGDWYCNEETERTIQNVINANPDLIITTGDHVKDVKSADCWIEYVRTIKR